MSGRGPGAGDRGEPSSDYTGSGKGDGELAGHLADVARVLESEDSIERTLAAIVHAAVGTVPGAEHASISSVEGRREVVTRASTDELPRAVDRAQYDTGQGPCLDSLYEQQTVRVAQMGAEQRWPDFARRAGELGVASMLAVQLYVDGDDLGALNLISRERGAFDDESEHVGLLFASHAAVAMAGAQQREHLVRARDHRDVIGQAKGILMERYEITAERAFAVLARYSQDTNRKLHDIAADLAGSGQLPAAGAADPREGDRGRAG